MNYKPSYDVRTGQLNCIIRLNDNASIPLCEDNMDYQQYLKEVPVKDRLPLEDKSVIVIPVPPRDLAKEIDELKLKVAELEEKIK